MDDDSCLMKYIEIVPLDKFEDCSAVKCEPLFRLKASVVSIFDICAHLCSNFIWFISVYSLTRMETMSSLVLAYAPF